MMTKNFIFQEDQFSRIFPFYILINEQLDVESNGASLEKFFAGTNGKCFSDNYVIKRPHLEALNFASVQSLSNQLLIIQCLNEQQTILRGQIEFLPATNQLLFLGSPWFESIEEVIQNNLSLSDFAPHDSLTDLLHVMKTQENTTEDLLLLLHKVKNQKDALKQSSKAFHDIALFTTQNPDPLMRINFAGDLIQNNPAASQLDFFEFENKDYRNDDFFKQIADRIDVNEERLTIEACSDKRIYSFDCIPMEAEGYINIYGRDITKEKDIQEKLKEFDKRIILAMQKIGDNVWDFNINTGEIVFSQEDFLSFEYTAEQPSKNAAAWYNRMHPDDKKIFADTDKRYKAGLIDHHAIEYRIVTADGSAKWILDRGVVIEKSKDGLPLRIIGTHTDITAQKEIEKQVEASASRLTSLVSNLHAGILLENKERKIAVLNKRFCELFGIPADITSMIGADCSQSAEYSKHLFKSPELFISRINELLRERKMATGDVLELVDGRYLERDFVPVWHEGSYEGHLWMYTDITEKVTADKKLEEQRVFYEEILDNIPSDIAVFDKDHRYLYLNPKAIKDTYVRKWLIGKRDEDYVQLRNKPAALFNERRSIFNDIIASKQLRSWEEQMDLPDGAQQTILRNLFPVLNKNNEVKLVIGYGVDISQIKKIQQQIEQSEKRYRDVIENSLAIVTTHDLQGRFLTVNPVVSKTYGYTDREMIGHSLIEFVPENDQPFFESNYLNKIKEEKNFSGTFRVLHKDGSVIYTLFNNFLKEEPGKDPYVIGFAVDITERIRAEKELKLAKKITEELAQSKQNFLANMSHEIRTPMNAIMGMASQLGKTSLNKEQHFFLDTIHSASENLLIIINDILDLSKIEAGKLALEKIGFEPDKVIGRAMQVMRHKAEEKGLTFTNSHSDKMICPVLLGDPYRLNQILLNLISNAVKFTEKGSIDVSYSLVSNSDTHQTLRAIVKDTGIGMDETFAKNLFRKFSQEDESVTRKYGGTGLGMSICKDLVELMGGKINVESKKGEGTTVRFDISFEKGNETDLPQKITVKTNVEILDGKKILVVDDNKMNRLVAKAMLKNYGVEILQAVDGADAIQKIKEEHPHLVLMDVQMPVMDGIEATRIIRSSISLQLPVIALTAFAIKGDNVKCLDAGMNDYLSKPFEEIQLVNMISKWLGVQERPANVDIADLPSTSVLYNLYKINELAQGDPDFIHEMIDVFIEQATLSIQQIRIAFENNDTARIKAVAHRLKPTIDNMGITAVKSELRQLEVETDNLLAENKLEQLIEKIETILRMVITQLK